MGSRHAQRAGSCVTHGAPPCRGADAEGRPALGGGGRRGGRAEACHAPDATGRRRGASRVLPPPAGAHVADSPSCRPRARPHPAAARRVRSTAWAGGGELVADGARVHALEQLPSRRCIEECVRRGTCGDLRVSLGEGRDQERYESPRRSLERGNPHPPPGFTQCRDDVGLDPFELGEDRRVCSTSTRAGPVTRTARPAGSMRVTSSSRSIAWDVLGHRGRAVVERLGDGGQRPTIRQFGEEAHPSDAQHATSATSNQSNW
jgi:hypothetical protein